MNRALIVGLIILLSNVGAFFMGAFHTDKTPLWGDDLVQASVELTKNTAQCEEDNEALRHLVAEFKRYHTTCMKKRIEPRDCALTRWELAGHGGGKWYHTESCHTKPLGDPNAPKEPQPVWFEVVYVMAGVKAPDGKKQLKFCTSGKSTPPPGEQR